MKNITSNDAFIGTVVGYKWSLNMLSRYVHMIIHVEHGNVVVDVDSRQLKFVKKEYPEGSQVPVGFYGGKWHISSKPVTQDISIYTTEVPYMDVINSISKKAACES
ncbi:MAG TPA: hypothetical protein VMC84_13445 [Methanocella sp.]|uniref:hypothetical protein n=1 Tax=Methanocella sp. TaxID=2052833 RepID=UPI002B850180|nr:hypothetical protein [Methanocella sp.]HTY92174.1 hypothetical protein [Methanocella sp.]